MTIDWPYVRRIILNDRLVGYKPDRAALEKLSDKLPDAKVFGYGVYSPGPQWRTWYLLVESRKFWADESPTIQAIPINQIPVRKLALVPSTVNPAS